MSLVNDMLRDLEQRRSDAPAVEMAWMKNNDVGFRPQKTLIALLLIALIVAAIVWLMRGYIGSAVTSMSVSSAVAIKTPADNQAAEKTSSVIDVAPQVALKVQLEDLTQEVTDNGFVFRLQFNAAVRYTTETKSNFLRLRFAGVQQSGNFRLPEIPPEFAILQLLDEGDALVLTLQTRSAVSYQLRRADQQTIVITLSGLSLSNASANDSTASLAATQTDATLAPALTTTEKPPVAMNDVVDVKQERQLTPIQRDKQVARQAKNNLRSGNRQQAREELSAFVEQYPDYARESGFLLASIMLENREQNAAIYLLKELRKDMPEDVSLRQLLAQAMITNNQLLQALTLLQEVSPPINTYPGYYEVLAAAAQKAGNPQLATKVYQSLLALDTTRGDWLIGYAIGLDAINQKDRATQFFLQALIDKQLAPALRQYAQQRLGQSVKQ